MTVLFMASFDTGDSPSSFGKWSEAPAAPTINATNPRFTGANAWQIGNAGHGTSTFHQDLGAGADDLVIVGAAIRFEGALNGESAGTLGLVRLTSDARATIHLTLTSTSTGALRVRLGTASGTILATSTDGVVALDNWHYIEFKALLHDTAGEVYVHVNGAEVLAWNPTIAGGNVDTKNGGTETVFSSVDFGTTSGTTRTRDVYIANGAGSVNNDFLGDCRVRAVFPDADSTPEDWTLSTGADTFALIDEVTPNGDTDYIESDVEGEIARVGLGDTADTTHVIYAVQTSVYARKDDAGARTVRVGLFSDATLGNGVDHSLSTSFATKLDVFELDPDGAVAWTPAQFNAAFAQVEVRP